MSFKEKMAMFNKKSSPSQKTNIVKKKSSPKLARRLSQLGKKLPVDDKKKDSETNRPAPQRIVPKRLPQPIRVKPPVSRFHISLDFIKMICVKYNMLNTQSQE